LEEEMKYKLLNVFTIAIISLVCSTLYALDLRFSGSMSMSPETPSVGDTITFSVNFISQDGAAANLKVIGGVDGAEVYERTFANVPSGATRTISFTWPSTAGGHTAWFELDPDRSLRETDLTNNRIEIRFNGGAPLTADLTVSSVRLTHDESNPNKMFYTVKFKNLGDACIGAFNWKMYGKAIGAGVDLCKTCPNGRFAAGHPLCALSGGEEKTHYGFFLKSDYRNTIKEECSREGVHIKYKYYNHAYFEVDHDGKVDETNERNNKSGNYTIVWKNECAED
jgi:hypothetical protein